MKKECSAEFQNKAWRKCGGERFVTRLSGRRKGVLPWQQCIRVRTVMGKPGKVMEFKKGDSILNPNIFEKSHGNLFE